MTTRCPRCDSPQPHLHPAVQCGGEVSPCSDGFHRLVTAQNTAGRIADLNALLREGSSE